MPRLLSPAAPALLLSGAVLLGGCGSRQVDVAALKAHLTGVADALDACVARTGDARRCADAKAIGSLPGGAELGDEPGQITIRATRPMRYELVSQVGDDVRFSVLAAPVGARKRFCLPAGRGDCPNSGAW